MEHSIFTVSWWGLLPFAALLAAIAIFPLWKATRHRWEDNLFKLYIALILGLPVTLWLLIADQGSAIIHSLLEYFQFIVLLFSLYTISGNIFLRGDIRATPRNNTLFLAFGGIIASFIGTTGAAMVLIRPILNTNQERTRVTHTVVFAIFVIANCGGLLTPLGDPPLFLGMLRGVPFAWTFSLWPYWLFVVGSLLLIYYLMDTIMYRQEPLPAVVKDEKLIEPLSIMGGRNITYLAGIVLTVAFAPSIDLRAIHDGMGDWRVYVPLREIIMLSLTGLSLLGSQAARRANRFDFHPIQEVAYLFIGIFLTMIPALMYLRQVAPTLPLNEMTFFIFTGGLSSVLDNAPTYLTFFEMGQSLGGQPAIAGVFEPYLVSISLGAVFCGAMTYIGNGPNFMVKAIAERRGINMPSFAGYLRWSILILVPLFACLLLLFF